MRWLGLSLVSYMLAATSAAVGAPSKASDFFCRPKAGAPAPRYFEHQLRKCDSGEPDHRSGVCQEDVECAYVSAENKTAALAKYKDKSKTSVSSFDDLTSDAKAAALKLIESKVSFKPSFATCAAKPAEKGKDPTCPAPDECKADTLIDVKVATLSTAGNPDNGFVPATTGKPSSSAAGAGFSSEMK